MLNLFVIKSLNPRVLEGYCWRTFTYMYVMIAQEAYSAQLQEANFTTTNKLAD